MKDEEKRVKNMKIVCVSDFYIKPEYYRDCMKQFDNVELIDILNFGATDGNEMRAMVHEIETKGPYAYPAPDGLFDAVKEADLLMVHLCPVTKELMDAAPNLKYILSNRGGLENIDIEAAKERNIGVLFNPAHNANAVAELTIALAICEMRNVTRANIALKNGEWRGEFPNSGQVYEMRNKVFGLIGFGTIVKNVAEKLQPFHMKLMTYDPFLSPDHPDLKKYNVELVDMETLLKNSDIVSIHARTPNKEAIIGEKEIAMMKPTAILVNTARAYLVDYDALAKALEERKIMGAALDVFPSEPLPADSPFLKLDNVTLTNHRGGDTVNSYSDSPEYLMNELFELVNNGKQPRFYIG